jgi:hypothetical protein
MDYPPLTKGQREYLEDQYSLSAENLDRLLEDIWAFTALSPQAFAVKRHTELKSLGRRNEAIYAELLSEIEGGRFQTQELSERQVRRMIYG